MNELSLNNSNEISMSSVEFFKFLREENPNIKHAVFLEKLEDELDTANFQKTEVILGTSKVTNYYLDEYDLIRLGGRLNKGEVVYRMIQGMKNNNDIINTPIISNESNGIGMWSVDFYRIIKSENPKIRHNEFISKLEDELDVIGLRKIRTHLNHITVTNYYLDEYDLIQLGSRLSKPIRKQTVELIKRLKTELEYKPKLPQNYIEALEYLVVSEKEKQIALETVAEQQETLSEQAPKVYAFEKMMDSNGLISFSEYAKSIYDVKHMGRNTLMDDLRKRGVLLKTSNLPQQQYIDKEIFKVVFNDRGNSSAKITRKGIEFLNSIYLRVENKPINLFEIYDKLNK